MTDTGVETQAGEDLLELPAPSRKNQRWTLLLVGDSGRIVRIRRVRGWITLLVALPVVALALVTGGYLRSDNRPVRDRAAIEAVARLEDEVRALRQENTRLAGRDPSTEPEADSYQAADRPAAMPPAVAPSALPSMDAPRDALPDQVSDSVEMPAAAEEPAPMVTAEGHPVTMAAVDEPGDSAPAPSTEVAVKDLALNLDPHNRTAQVRFKIVNRRLHRKPFAGYAFVVLKPSDRADDSWLVFPEAVFNSQGPASFDNGFDFNISNFMFIKFKPQPIGTVKTFDTATVLIYDTTGRLVLKTDFDLAHTE